MADAAAAPHPEVAVAAPRDTHGGGGGAPPRAASQPPSQPPRDRGRSLLRVARDAAAPRVARLASLARAAVASRAAALLRAGRDRAPPPRAPGAPHPTRRARLVTWIGAVGSPAPSHDAARTRRFGLLGVQYAARDELDFVAASSAVPVRCGAPCFRL